MESTPREDLMFVGLAMLAFTVIVGLTALVLGVSFAARPAEAKLATLRPLSLAVILASVSSIVSGLAMSFARAAETGLANPPATPGMLMAGLAEAMVTAAVGFALLAVAWLCVGIGMRRQP
jgi:O-antigen/teichoic acid export membrane protein